MADPPSPFDELRRRLETVEAEGQRFQQEGLPFPTAQIRATFDEAEKSGAPEKAALVVKRAEALLARVSRDWGWVRELMRRVDELRGIAQELGVDLAHLDARVGNPRARLLSDPLSAGSLEKAAASASLALAVLNDAVPKFCLQEAQALGTSIRRARDRGEEVGSAARSFSRLLQAVQDENLPTAAQRLIETRRIVAQIRRAPTVAHLSAKEEEEILLEARNLARRLQRIKTSARDAHGAARLMAQVRAALAEDRRSFGTPEEEIEELWREVDRITEEKRRAAGGGPPPITPAAPVPLPPPPLPPPASKPSPTAPRRPSHRPSSRSNVPPPPPTAPPEPQAAEERKLEEETYEAHPFALYVPFVPVPVDVPEPSLDGPDGPAAARRSRPRPRP